MYICKNVQKFNDNETSERHCGNHVKVFIHQNNRDKYHDYSALIEGNEHPV